MTTFLDHTEAILGTCTQHLGEDVSYTHQGGSAYTVRGIFSETAEEFGGAGVPVLMRRPNLGVRLSDLTSSPRKGDTVSVRSVSYKVSEVVDDGESGATLYLQLA